MADGSKRPAQGALDRSPSAPTPLGALSPLPEVLLAHLCSFLSGRDLARLGGACTALHESPVSLWPRLRVGLRSGLEAEDEEGFEEERQRRRVEALRTLARRAASGLKELRMEDAEVMEAFCSAVREGGRPLCLLSSLHVGNPDMALTDEGQQEDEQQGCEQRLLAEMLAAGQLPMLRELHLEASAFRSAGPVWRAVGEGACPRLERIKIRGCSSQQLSELAEAMRARPEGCEELRAVSLKLQQVACKALQALLNRLSPRSLEELCLKELPSESPQAAILPLLTSSWSALKTLKLGLWATPSIDGLLHALARGAMPSLTCLDLTGGTCSDEAWRALGEAMGPEGTCLRRIKTLKLYQLIRGPHQVAILCGAMGAGHGCPELEVILIAGDRDGGEEPWGAALAPAFRPPHGLPRLKELHLSSMNLRDLDQLVEALQHRPDASQPVEVIKLMVCKLESAAALGRAMQEGGALAGLRQLGVGSGWEGVVKEWPMQLAEALAGGAGQQLEEIEWRTDGLPGQAINRLLQGLAVRGACPRLRRLMLGRPYGPVAQGGQLDASSLGTILAGRAACSDALRELQLRCLSNEGVRRLAACLQESRAIQLESLELRAGEPDACEAVMELLSALGGRAGGRLRNLFMHLSRCERGEVTRVVEHAVGVIKAGGLPALGLGPFDVRIHASGRPVDHRELYRALEERAHAQWLASW